MKIGFLSTSFPVPGYPYSGIFVGRLAGALSEFVQIQVECPQPDNDLPLPSGSNLSVRGTGYAPRRWRILAHRPGGVPEALRRAKPATVLILPLLLLAMARSAIRLAREVDLVHGHWSIPGFFGAVAASVFGKPAVVTLRGEDVTRASTSAVARTVLRMALHLNQFTAVVGEEMAQLLRSTYPRYQRKIVLIPNGVDVDLPPIRRLTTPLRLITVGSLIERKGIATILRALSELKNELPLQLRIVGDGPQRRELQALSSRLGLEEIVEFRGGVSPDLVERELAWSEVFILASTSEGRPNALLEAMAAGRVTLATDISGVRELLMPDRGFLFPVGDHQACAAAIREVHANAERAVILAEAGRQFIRDAGLTWRACASQYLELYNEALRDRS